MENCHGSRRQLHNWLPDCLSILQRKLEADSSRSKQTSTQFSSKSNRMSYFTRNLERAANTRMFFIIKEVKETTADLSQETKCTVNRFFSINIK